jgi:serine/threonine-protein kinase HipA
MYDRKDQTLNWRDQEDFFQALGIVSENKYQKEGGPPLKQCFALLREVSSAPVLDLARLLDAVIINFLVGNNDAHGKPGDAACASPISSAHAITQS